MADETAYKIRTDPTKRILPLLLAPYRCKVRFSTGEWGIFGRGSLNLARAVAAFGDAGTETPAIIAGDFCELADGCTIMLGGEHQNQHPVNHTFRQFALVHQALLSAGAGFQPTFSRGAVRIGHNVTISRGVTIRSGVQIGDGAVIGAESFVAGGVPAFAVAGGIPAKAIKMRFDDEMIAALAQARWWDWELNALVEHLGKIYSLQTSELIRYLQTVSPPCVVRDDSCFVLTTYVDQGWLNFHCEGVEVGGRFITVADLPETCRLYLAQAAAQPGAEVMVMHHFFSQLETAG